MRVELVTFNDVIEHLIDWMGANPTAEARRDAKRATLQAMREVGDARNWAYYYTLGRFNTVAPYSTGTVSYDHTGGTYERQLTLDGGQWPAWAALGRTLIDDKVYEIAERKSDTILTLTSGSNPGEDIVGPSSFTIFRDQFPLQANCQSTGGMIIAAHSRVMTQEHPSNWISRQRVWRGMGCPVIYSMMGDPNYQNTIAIALYPPPDDEYALEYIYKRRPRPL